MSRAQHVYIATAAANAPAARDLAASLRAAGHNVVSTWHDEDGIELRRPAEAALTRRTRRAIATRCVTEILSATVLIVISHPEMRGALVEVGIAVGALIPVDWLGDDTTTLFSALAADPPVLGGA